MAKNNMVVVWDDLKELPETGSADPISPKGKLIINGDDTILWEQEDGVVVCVSYHNDVCVGFSVIENGEVSTHCSPVGNAVYGHGSKKRAEEMVKTLLSAFRRYTYKKTKVSDRSGRQRKTAERKAGEMHDQTPSYVKTVRKGRKETKEGTAKAEMVLHQVCKHDRKGGWCVMKATGKRYYRTGGPVRGHWRGKGAKELNSGL